MIKKSFVLYLLYFFISLLIINAVPAGVMFIIDPSGAVIGLSTDTLQNSPFSNYLIPGLFFVTGYGADANSNIVWIGKQVKAGLGRKIKPI